MLLNYIIIMLLKTRTQASHSLNYTDLTPFMLDYHPKDLNFNLMDCVKHFQALLLDIDIDAKGFDIDNEFEKRTILETILSIERRLLKIINEGKSLDKYDFFIQKTDNFDKFKDHVGFMMVNYFKDFTDFGKGDDIFFQTFPFARNYYVLQNLMLFFIFSSKSLTLSFIDRLQYLYMSEIDYKYKKQNLLAKIQNLTIIPFYKIENIKKLLTTSQDLQYLTLLQEVIIHIVKREHNVNPETMADTYFIDFSV